MVGAEGFEPPTLCSQSRCATRLRYAPTHLIFTRPPHHGLASLCSTINAIPERPHDAATPRPATAAGGTAASPASSAPAPAASMNTQSFHVSRRRHREAAAPADDSSGGSPATRCRTDFPATESPDAHLDRQVHDHPRDRHDRHAAKNAASTIMQLASPPSKSPTPGMNPMIPSSPNRIDVPGMRNQVSSTRDSRSRFSSRNAPPAPPKPRLQRARIHHARRQHLTVSPSSSPSSRAPLRPASSWMLQSITDTAAIVQWQNAALWQRMSWVRTPLAAPILLSHRAHASQPLRLIFAHALSRLLRDHLAARFAKLPSQSPLRRSAPNLFVGTSGWAYPIWKPASIPPSPRAVVPRLLRAPSSPPSKSTTPSAPSHAPRSLKTGMAATPAGFRFSFKAPQRITHFARLRDCEHARAELPRRTRSHARPATSARCSSSFRPTSRPTATSSRDFLDLLPPSVTAHVPLAFEFRHKSWFTDEIYAILREHNAALCVAESDDLSTPDVQSASHPLLSPSPLRRLHRARARRLRGAFRLRARDGEVYVFLKHEDEPTGALNAVQLQQRAAALAIRKHPRGSNG